MLLPNSVSARHIIGGEITYVCNGGGSYDFTMKVFRDCFGGGADFDNPAVVTIYRGNLPPYNIISNIDASLESQQEIESDANPCLIVPPNICVEEAIYTFTVTGLNPGNQSFHVSYQRCCRNETIDNIVEPGDAGATYTIEITPTAQGLCNNSPEYNEFPPTVICANEPLNFDHSASDIDGDQLVYSFCSPILGGGLQGTPEVPGDPTACNGVSPDPACPPPYNDVTFQLISGYSAGSPMGPPVGGTPQLSIDPNTGLITGTPTLVGQYVVGVCVDEYRAGTLLSTVRRDFQFNVTTCEQTVFAEIAADEFIAEDETFVINACGDNTVPFDNLSGQVNFIDEVRWDFDINGTPYTSSEFEPVITFPALGTYTGTLILNPANTQCVDTAFISVNVFPDITSGFTFDYDTCVAGPTQFTSSAFSNAGPIQEYFWDFGEGNFSMDENPSHIYEVPGSHNVSLIVTDENNCMDTLEQIIDYFPAPALLIIEPTAFDGCQPLDVFFDNLSIPIDSTYDITWDFGDGNTSGEISPSHTYVDDGTFTISIDVTSPIGCQTDSTFFEYIEVSPSPTAGFTFSPNPVNSFAPTVTFTDESQDALNWFWNFDNDGFAFEPNPVFEFPDTGVQVVQQVVTHLSGCQDSLTLLIDVVPRVTYHLPNAFSPNSDTVNDGFRGYGFVEGMENFNLRIWNRWGELIFETNDPEEEWNGQKYNTEELSPNGVYVVLVNYVGPRGNSFELKGYATLVK